MEDKKETEVTKRSVGFILTREYDLPDIFYEEAIGFLHGLLYYEKLTFDEVLQGDHSNVKSWMLDIILGAEQIDPDPTIFNEEKDLREYLKDPEGTKEKWVHEFRAMITDIVNNNVEATISLYATPFPPNVSIKKTNAIVCLWV